MTFEYLIFVFNKFNLSDQDDLRFNVSLSIWRNAFLSFKLKVLTYIAAKVNVPSDSNSMKFNNLGSFIVGQL